MSRDKAISVVGLTRHDGAGPGACVDDALAVEEPMEIRVDGRSVAVVMRTPGHDRELAAGFLVTEGILRRREEVLDMVFCRGGSGEPEENILDVVLAPGVAVDWTRLTRNVFTSSSCGICSKASIEAVRGQFPALSELVSSRREMLVALPGQLRAAQAGLIWKNVTEWVLWKWS